MTKDDIIAFVTECFNSDMGDELKECIDEFEGERHMAKEQAPFDDLVFNNNENLSDDPCHWLNEYWGE